MTDPMKTGDEPRPDQVPADEAVDSGAPLHDIHYVPPAEPASEAQPSEAKFVPLSSADTEQKRHVDALAVELTPIARTYDTPFDLEHQLEAPAEDAPGDVHTGDETSNADFHQFAAVPGDVSPTIESPVRPPAVAPAKSQINVLILTWASLATLTALYLWWTRPEYPSNLETIPDDGVLTSMLSNKKNVSPLSPLDRRLTLGLKETRRFGNLEVTPLSIEHRRVKVLASDGLVAYEPHVLALKLRVKNVGAGKAFAPSDPAFTSLVQRGEGPRAKNVIHVKGKVVFEDGYTYTFAHPVGDVESIDKRILPLSIEYKNKEKVAEQEFPILEPGESAEVLLLSQEDALPKLKGPMIWRVKLRKGRNEQGTGAAVVIGVPFQKENVVMTVAAPENRLDG